MVEEAFTVDFNKLLAFQVGHLGESYDEWVHQPILSKRSPRLFANDFIETFTKTPWWVVPLVWLPLVWLSVSNPTKNDITRKQIAVTVAAGVVMWTLMEYCLHRFLFHIKTTSYWGNTLHYILHGIHHKHPMDNQRLVLPPLEAVIFVIIGWSLTKLIIPSFYSWAFFGGQLLGYVVYDCMHYYIHYGKLLKLGFSYQLKKSHMNHHFKIQDKGFGVTSAFWDWVFGTLPSNSHKK